MSPSRGSMTSVPLTQRLLAAVFPVDTLVVDLSVASMGGFVKWIRDSQAWEFTNRRKTQRMPVGIYQNLAFHQRTEKWSGRDLATLLQEWAERFILEFKLHIAELAVCVDRLPISRLGHFRVGHNGFGLKGEIAINVRYLTTDRESFWRVLGTLLQ